MKPSERLHKGTGKIEDAIADLLIKMEESYKFPHKTTLSIISDTVKWFSNES